MVVKNKISDSNLTGTPVTINSSKMTPLLMEKLYNYPHLAVLRESIANAKDAGGKIKINFIKGNDFSGKSYVYVIRDYGTGIDPDYWNTKFLVLGDSNKDTSDDKIGGFGLGRFAGLTISDFITYTNYYNGYEYKTIISMTSNGVQAIPFETKKTDEPNGLKLEVPMKERDYAMLIKYMDL